jgi:two-component system response regulator CpxR
MEKILVIDDDIELCQLLTEYLSREGFHVDTVNSGDAGLKKACNDNYDLLVLDVMLPSLNGFEILSRLRKQHSTPVIMLTARGNDVDRIVGLEMGADDYLSKPFNARELVARMRAILRRSSQERFDAVAPDVPKKIKIGDVTVDPGARAVSCCGEPVDLTSVEFSLLEMLVRKAGHLVTREELMLTALNRSISPYDRSLDVHVSRIRKKLDKEDSGIERIITIRSAGYLYTNNARPDNPDD